MSRTKSYLPRLIRPLLIVVGFSLATCDSALPTDVLGECTDNPRQGVLDLVNVIRAENGLDPLLLDLRLALSAQVHSEDMAQHDFMSHTGSNGSSPGDRITAAGYPWTSWSENVAAGQPTAQSVVDAWMDSQGHRENILRATSEHVGIGYGHEGGTTFGHYWTMNFGSSASPPASGVGCHP